EQHYQPPPVMPSVPREERPASQAIPAGYNPLDDALSEAPPVTPRPSAPARPYAAPRAAPSAPSIGQPPSNPVTPRVAAPAFPSPEPSVAPIGPLARDPFADPLTPNPVAAAHAGPVPAAPLDLDALMGPPPPRDETPSIAPKRPKPGSDAQ